MIVAQFWALANDIYTQEQGERLFPVVAFGASIGAVAGSQLSSSLIRPLGLEQLLLVSAGLLGITIALVRWIERQSAVSVHDTESSSTEDSLSQPEEAKSEVSKDGQGAFALVLRSPYLLLVAGLMFFTNLVNSNGEFILGKLVVEYAQEQVASGASGGMDVDATIGLFYSDFFMWVNIAGVVLQLFVV